MKTVLLFIGVLTISCSVVSAKTWTIKPDGTGEVPTIQAGVDTAASGDTLLLAPGTYTGEGNRRIFVWEKDVSFISEAGAASTIVDCGGADWGIWFERDVTNASIVSGLTIENAYTLNYGGGIHCDYDASPRIENNIIRNCTAGWGGGGISVALNTNPLIQNNLITGCIAERGGGVYISRCWSTTWFAFNTITDNTATQSGGGVYLWEAWPWIYNNTICDNDAPSGAGIFLTGDDSHPDIDNTIIAFNSTGEGMVCADGALPTLGCCDIYGNAGGDAMCGLDAGNNFSADPQFCETTGNGGYWLWDTSPCAIGNSPCNMFVGARPVGCQATGIADRTTDPSGLRLTSYRNPFHALTTITYSVPESDIRLAIFDVKGRLVTVLRDGYHDEGEYRVSWDGRRHDGAPVAGGVYFVRLEAAGRSQSHKILLLK